MCWSKLEPYNKNFEAKTGKCLFVARCLQVQSLLIILASVWCGGTHVTPLGRVTMRWISGCGSRRICWQISPVIKRWTLLRMLPGAIWVEDDVLELVECRRVQKTVCIESSCVVSVTRWTGELHWTRNWQPCANIAMRTLVSVKWWSLHILHKCFNIIVTVVYTHL